jgi:peptide methionine sulfoxide reductase MsrB
MERKAKWHGSHGWPSDVTNIEQSQVAKMSDKAKMSEANQRSRVGQKVQKKKKGLRKSSQ